MPIKHGIVLMVASMLLLAAISLNFSQNAMAAPAPPSADIVNGTQVTDPTAWGSIVAVLSSTNSLSQFCGGTLIKPQWVVTAAHCVDPAEAGASPNYVAIGRKDLSSSAGEVIPIASIYEHPNFDFDTLQNDIALLKLSYAPASIVTSAMADTTTDPPNGVSVHIAGWGRTTPTSNNPADYPNELRETMIETMSNASCASIWGPGAIFASSLCAAHFAGSATRGGCFGDSGGPLIYNPPSGPPVLAGLTSFGTDTCADPVVPAVYTRISSYRGWIAKHTGKFIDVSATAIDFGAFAVGSVSPARTITFTSAGEEAVTINNIALSQAGDFSINGSDCPETLASGQSCHVSVSLSPASTGLRISALNLATNAEYSPVTAVSLYGHGIDGLAPPVPLKLRMPTRSKPKGKKLLATFDINYSVPLGLSPAAACTGLVQLTLKFPGRRKTFTRVGAVIWAASGCKARLSMKLPKREKRKKASASVTYRGNSALAPSTLATNIRVK